MLIFTDEEHEKNYIIGQVVTTFFENSANFYKVLLISVKETNTPYMGQEIVITGTFGQIQDEEIYRFYGDIVNHPKYGEQLKVDSYQQEKPTSEMGMITYLSSSKFPGIGKKIAEHIVNELGTDAIDKMIDDPNCLVDIKGLTAKKRTMLIEKVKENYGMEKIIIGLNQYGFGNQLAFSIYQVYKEETLSIINENPYQLVEDVEGVGFKKADALAESVGISAKSKKRIRAALIHELFKSCLNTGNTYMEAKQLLEVSLMTLEASRPVEIDPADIAEEIICLAEEGAIIQENTRLYEKSLYFSEVGIATSIHRLLKRKKEIKYPKKDISKGIKSIEKQFNIQYGQSQIKAIQEAITSPLFILTGGPGTGKTTVVNGLVTLFAELNGFSLDINDYKDAIFPILLAAPTGRAAKRMNEMTDLPACTIHRLLGLTGREKEVLEEAKELEGGLLIVDEMSMVDTWLANTLLKAIPNNMQVIFVGDKDQLPSVGPGQVLTDLLAVPEIPKRELKDIYRQEDGSTIISLAHSIKDGKLPTDLTVNQKDRSFIACSVNQIESVVEQVVLRAKEKGFSSQNIQVLAPMYRGKAGIDQLNQKMQDILNGEKEGTRKEVKWLDKTYRIGDKVLHLVNSPEFNVFNGDMGEITGITYAKETEDKIDEMTLLFDETEVTYKRQEWNKFTLAYACSIHKSQGSEFQMVILPLVKQYGRMLQRKLVYTAVTRSKDLLILLGEREAFREAIESEMIPRQTTLEYRLTENEEALNKQEIKMKAYEEEQTEAVKEELSKEESSKVVNGSLQDDVSDDSTPVVYELSIELIDSQQIDPLIGMENSSPYDFL